MDLTCEPLRLETRHPFTIATGSSVVRENVLVRLTDAEGREGLGEAAPVSYRDQNVDSIRRDLRRADGILRTFPDALQLEEIEAALRREIPLASSARAAVSMALHDLTGQTLGRPLWQLLGLSPEQTPATSFTIGIADREEMLAKVAEAAHMPILKLKVGFDGDVDIVQAIRDVHAGAIRVDANGGWSEREAAGRIRRLADLGVEFIEQPIPAGDPAAMARVRRDSPLPIVADESAQNAAELPALIGAVDGINIKLSKCGSLREAWRMVAFARAVGWRVMLGCMIESSVGITAAAHLAPLLDDIDLDGALLLKHDPFTGAVFDGARLVLPSAPGLGVAVRN